MAGEDINMLTMMCTKLCTVKTDKKDVQEVFHVYLNKFENAVTHLFLVILGNN